MSLKTLNILTGLVKTTGFCGLVYRAVSVSAMKTLYIQNM